MHRRRLRLLFDRPAPDAHRGGRRARRRGSRRRVHHAGGALDRGTPGDGDRRRRRGSFPAHVGNRRVLQRDRRRRHAHRRRRLEGDRLRRRRGDDRLPPRPRRAGAGARLPLGDGDLPPLAAAWRTRGHPSGRHPGGDPARPRPGERWNLQPDRRAPHLDGHLRLRGHPRLPARRGNGGPGPADRGQAATARAVGRHGLERARGVATGVAVSDD